MRNMGKRQYFGSGWNWIDINMIGLVFISYIMWIVIYFVYPEHQSESFNFFKSFPDGFFAVAIILSFFRMVCLCQITRFLGLLQLCLGRMLQVRCIQGWFRKDTTRTFVFNSNFCEPPCIHPFTISFLRTVLTLDQYRYSTSGGRKYHVYIQ